MTKIRRISEEIAAAKAREKEREERDQPKKRPNPYPKGDNIEVKANDTRDRRCCVIQNPRGLFLRYLPNLNDTPEWETSVYRAVQVFGPIHARVIADRVGGIPRHYHLGNVYDVTYHEGVYIPKTRPGVVDVV